MGEGLQPWQRNPVHQLRCIAKLPSGTKVLHRQPKEWLLCSVYANLLNLVVIERPVNYPRAGVILFAVYKQRDDVWLALRNAASEDNRFRALCTSASLPVFYLWGMEFSCILWSDKYTCSSNLVFLERCSLVKENVLHRKYLPILFAVL